MSKTVNGKKGEDYAARFLEKHGYTILERNYHSRFGEIDLIARKGDILAFVEVKTRAVTSWGTPAAAVTREKQHKLIRTAQYYTMIHPNDEIPRFDVIAITTRTSTDFVVTSCEHIEGAFVLDAANGSSRYR